MTRTGQLAPTGIALALASAVVLVYGRVAGHDFVSYDDDVYVYDNPHVLKGLSWSGIRWAFTSVHAANYHPLTWMSHMLDVELFDLDAGAHHLVSVFLHALNSVLCFFALRALTRSVWPSALAAALFALHPLRVESVAWIAERKDVLVGTFWMLCLLAYASYARAPSLARYGLVAVCFALALLAKPMAVTLPLVLLLLDFWPLRRWPASVSDPSEPLALPSLPSLAPTHPGKMPPGPTRALLGHTILLEKLPLLLIAIGSALVTLMAQRVAGAASGARSVPFLLRCENALTAYGAYLAKIFWPRDLAVFYPHPAVVGSHAWRDLLGACVLSGLVVLLACWTAILWRRRHPWFLVGWAWYLITLVPVIGLVQVGAQAYADRYTYLPSIGVFVIVAFAANAWIEHRPSHRMPVLVALGILSSLSWLTWRQVSVWKSSASLFEHAIEVTDENPIAHAGLGFALLEAGELDAAETHLQRALEIYPFDATALNNLGLLYIEKGDLERAREHLERAKTIHASWRVRYNLGRLAMQEGKPERASVEFEKALELAPWLSDALVNLGQIALIKGNDGEARARFEQALALEPGSPGAHNGLGIVALNDKQLEEALRLLERAVELEPSYADAHHNLGVALERLGRRAEAAASYARERELKGSPRRGP